MDDVSKFIESGILELYVLEQTSEEETLHVQYMAAQHAEVRDEIEAISIAFESYAIENAEEPQDPTLKTMLMATINYMERMHKGEAPSFPPILNADTQIADYAQWLNREDLQLTPSFDGAYARIIGNTPEAMTAIVWLQHGAPPETHIDKLEKFLVVEGTCEITIGEKVHMMKPGDTLAIPLHISHHVRVTSPQPCKVILQRIAA